MPSQAIDDGDSSGLVLADLIDAARHLPFVRAVEKGAEFVLPVSTRDGGRVQVTFRRSESQGNGYSQCWWEPLGFVGRSGE
jgi:hypothetical protein